MQQLWNEYIQLSLAAQSLKDITFALKRADDSIIKKLKLTTIQDCLNLAIAQHSISLVHIMACRISVFQLMELSESSRNQALLIARSCNPNKEAQEIEFLMPEEMEEKSKITPHHDR